MGSEAKAINASGEVAGEVNSVVNNSLIPYAAVWDLSGALRGLDQTPGHLTRAAAIADNGTVLVERTVPADTAPVGSLELHANGRITVLTPPSPGDVFAAVNKRSLSADGSTVVGSWVMAPTPGNDPVLHAFMHQQGLTQDLTDLARAKGVNLHAGTYFSAAAGVNAKGVDLGHIRGFNGIEAGTGAINDGALTHKGPAYSASTLAHVRQIGWG
ncbi:hypothetical protein [Aquabacterium sp.]|uniref:hypothetical protein n=1 Tax=Aquabacterium sp. TaxID=1872578 RepID=UPI0019CC2853|nr:hypothetical protein [Aquabacterium sp.]MBC7699566.1 hypothetical protein [Aquabacterium sp.]